MVLEGKKIAFLGDSITRGIYLPDENDCYAKIVERAVPWGEFHNYSVPGSRIGEYIGPDPKHIKGSFLERYPQMPDGMDIVVVFGGTNDFGIGNAPMGEGTDRSPETFCGAVNLLMDELKEKYPEATVVVITPLHRRNENIPNEYSGAILDEYIWELCKKAVENGFHLFDLRSVPALQPTVAYYRDLIIEDGIHPNEKAHQIIADELLQYLKSL